MRRRLAQAYRDLRYITLGLPRLRVRPTDGFLVSWPRSGNTWLRQMVANALYPDSDWDLMALEEHMPIIENPKLRRLLPAMESLPFRIFKSHDDATEYLLAGRVVYLIRDGRDALTSFYHYRTKLNRRSFTFREFLEKTLAGRYRYGPWHRHVSGWLAWEDHPSLLVLKYEDMLSDPTEQLRRTLEHFGSDVPSDRLREAVERASIDRVHRGFQKYAKSKGDDREFSGGLGGGAGKYHEQFTEDDLALFMQHAGDLMRRLGHVSGRTVGCAPVTAPGGTDLEVRA